MAIAASDIAFKASNNVVSTIGSLGGTLGSTLYSQSATQPILVTGCYIISASNNITGVGQLTYNPANQNFSWQPPGSLSTYSLQVTVDGTYTVGSASGSLMIQVTSVNLPLSFKAETITITNNVNNVFNDVSPLMSLNGNTQYRCLYIKNQHATLTANNLILFISSQPSGPNSIAIGVAPQGVGDGVTTGVAEAIANENTAPTGVTFTAPLSTSTGIVLGSLTPGQSIAFWQKRVVPPNSFGSIAIATAVIGIALLG